ncbi:MAG: YhcH/YjgK/YiaL family protein [Opitutales bacterium]
MLYGTLNDPATWQALVHHPALTEALAWLTEHGEGLTPGRHPFGTQHLSALVEEYAPLPRERCRFESHRAMVDIQLVLAGAERIDVTPTQALSADGAFAAEAEDVQFHQPGPAWTSLLMAQGCIALFDTGDAHRPKVLVPGHDAVRKAVVKVPRQLLRS